MEKTFQMDNTDVNAIHDRLTGELQSNGFEVVRDEPRDNGFKVLVRRGEEHGEVEVFNDWGAVRLITHGRLEWELMNIAEPLFNQPGGPAPSQPSMQPPQAPQQFPRPMPPYPTAQGYQSSMPQLTQPQSPQPTQPMYHPVPQFPQGGSPEHMQLVNVLMQNGYQIEVNTVNGQVFFVRGRKGNYVVDIEGRPQP